MRRLIIIVLSITLLVHLSYIDNGFTWLDHGDIERKRAVLDLDKIAKSFFTRFGQTNFYRPVVTITESIDLALFNTNASGFHLTNIILHLAATYATYLFLQAFFHLSVKDAALGSLVFAVHPLSWLPVGAISYRSEILASLFSMLAIYMHTMASRTLSKRDIGLTILFLFLAIFSKESALVWVLFLIIYWEVINSDTKFKERRVLLGIEFLVFSIYLILRQLAVPEIWNITKTNLSLNEFVGTKLYILAKQYLYQISPFKPPLSDATKIIDLLSIYPILELFFFVICILVVIKNGIGHRLSKIIIFSFIALLPLIGFLHIPRANSPHYSYFASIGSISMIIYLKDIFRKRSKYLFKIYLATVSLWILIASYITFMAGFNFENDLTLFKPEVENNPDFLEGRYYLGNFYLKNRDFEKADREYGQIMERSEKIISYYDKKSLLINYAAVKLFKENYSDAEKLLLIVNDEEDYKDPLNVYNLALVYFKKGDYAKTIEVLNKYVDIWNNKEPVILYFESIKKLGDKDKIQEEFIRNKDLFSEEEKEYIEELIK